MVLVVVGLGGSVVIMVSGVTTSTRGDSTFLQNIAYVWATVALNSIPPKKSVGACHWNVMAGLSSGDECVTVSLLPLQLMMWVAAGSGTLMNLPTILSGFCISLACNMNPPMGTGAPAGLPIVTFKVSPCRTWDDDVSIRYGGTVDCGSIVECRGSWSMQAPGGAPEPCCSDDFIRNNIVKTNVLLFLGSIFLL